MSKWITILVEVVIFTSIIGVIATQVAGANANISGAALVVYGLITLFVIIGFVMAILKQAGVSSR